MFSDANEPNFRFLLESGSDLCLVLTPEFRILAASDAYLHARVTTREQILGFEIFEAFPDDLSDPTDTGVPKLRASLEQVLHTKRADTMAVRKCDIRRAGLRNGGYQERFWRQVNSPALDARGEVVYILHRIEEVTESVRLTGEGVGPLEERSEAIVNTEFARSYQQIAALMTQDAPELLVRGGLLPSPNSVTTISPEEMLSRLGCLIARYKSMEEELRQSQNLDALGRLTGRLAHDFNNYFSVIIGVASLLLRQLDPHHPMFRRVDEIRGAGQRAAELTRKLLAFPRIQPVEPRVVDLASTLGEMDSMLRRLLGENIEMSTDIDQRLARVKMDPAQFQQVIRNLVENAHDAMPRGGKLNLELRNMDISEHNNAQDGLSPGPYVMLAVTDTGTGVSQEVQRHLFEPFFTTKRPGAGAGLGLATVHWIVQQNGGAIRFCTELGTGTTFKVFIPIVEGQPPAAVPQTGRTPTSLVIH
jgi:signal transduction histidine kinase